MVDQSSMWKLGGLSLMDLARRVSLDPGWRAEHPVRTIRVHKEPVERADAKGRAQVN